MEIAVEALGLGDADIRAVALVAGQVHRFIERHAFTTDRAAALVLLLPAKKMP